MWKVKEFRGIVIMSLPHDQIKGIEIGGTWVRWMQSESPGDSIRLSSRWRFSRHIWLVVPGLASCALCCLYFGVENLYIKLHHCQLDFLETSVYTFTESITYTHISRLP